MVLIAVAGSYFIHRLCSELSRICKDVNPSAEENKEETSSAPKQEAVIDKLKKQEADKKKQKTKEAEKKAASKKAAKEKQEATQARKMLEAIEFITICLESFAYYYYVQRRALLNQNRVKSS